MRSTSVLGLALAIWLGWSATPSAQTTPATAAAPAAAPVAAPPAAPDSLVVYFDTGSTAIRADEITVLDQASRTFREGQPIVMVLAGSTDTVGTPLANLELSRRRAEAVLRGLVARGIPADHFQLLAKGQTELPVPTEAGKPEQGDRRVVITWR